MKGVAMSDKYSIKPSTDFENPEDWRAHVREMAPPEEVAYVLEFGQTTRYIRFYEIRKHPFPSEFSEELSHIAQLDDPARTVRLRALNQEIMLHMIQFLREAAPGDDGTVIEESSRERIEDLFKYLGRKNRYFAVWRKYESLQCGPERPDWEEFVYRELSAISGPDVEFTLMMPQLGSLLVHFRDKNLPIPEHHLERISFLHNLRAAERNLQVRLLMRGLMGAIDTCTSA
jgi:hypothetical protein